MPVIVGASMAELKLREILAMDVVKRGRPEVVVGNHLLERTVRWVHTSEIAEIGPLLKGGELLLTTGLGLAGATSAGIQRYVDELADRHVAALAIELGRTFKNIADPMRDEAERQQLPLIALHAVVPFVEITERVHSELLDRRADLLELSAETSRILNEALLSGWGLPEIMRTLSTLMHCRVALRSAAGFTVESAAFFPRELESSIAGPRVFPIQLLGARWGDLIVERYGLDHDEEHLRIIGDRAVTAISLELLRTLQPPLDRYAAKAALMEDIVADRAGDPQALLSHLSLVGFRPTRDTALFASAVQLDNPDRASGTARTLERIAAQTMSATVVGQVSDRLILLGALRSDQCQDLRGTLDHLRSSVNEELQRQGLEIIHVLASGPVTTDVRFLPHSVSVAVESLTLAISLGLHEEVILSADIDVYRLLSHLTNDPELKAFVESQLGPLIEYETRHGGQLIKTLRAYLGGGSKTSIATSLRVNRQSLYYRLSKVEQLLGHSPDDPGSRESLTLALKAWDLIGSHQRTHGPLRPR
jgi:purine catabolism regulator